MKVSPKDARKLADELMASRRLGTGLILCFDKAAVGKLRRQALQVLDDVKRSELVWRAPSQWHALVWLAIAGHATSCDTQFAQKVSHALDVRDVKLTFRGQPHGYSHISPSLWRLDLEARKAHLTAASLMLESLERLLDAVDEGVRKSEYYNHAIDCYWPDDGDASAFAQHYEIIKTPYVDWTLAPEVGFFFACQSNSRDAAVFLDRASVDQPLFGLRPPPTLCRRLWSQFGLLLHHEAYEGLSFEELQKNDMRPTDRCSQIVFDIDSRFEGIPKSDIMLEDDYLRRLSAWCLHVAECCRTQPTHVRTELLGYVQRRTAIPHVVEVLRQAGCRVEDFPEPATSSALILWTDAAPLIANFIDFLCMKYRQGKFVHDAIWIERIWKESSHLKDVLLALKERPTSDLTTTEKLSSAASLFTKFPILERTGFETEGRYSALERLSADLLAPKKKVPL